MTVANLNIDYWLHIFLLILFNILFYSSAKSAQRECWNPRLYESKQQRFTNLQIDSDTAV